MADVPEEPYWQAPLGLAVFSRRKRRPTPWIGRLPKRRRRLTKGTVSSEELTKLCLARIHKLDPALNAFITLGRDQRFGAGARMRPAAKGRPDFQSSAWRSHCAQGQYRYRRSEDNGGGECFQGSGIPPKMLRSPGA